jgi:hypothetical protein
MKREKLKLTREEALDIISDDHNEFEVVVNEIQGTSRWSEHHYIVVKRKSDNKYFADSYSKGLTEMQDESPYEYNDPTFTEVFLKEKTITKYE